MSLCTWLKDNRWVEQCMPRSDTATSMLYISLRHARHRERATAAVPDTVWESLQVAPSGTLPAGASSASCLRLHGTALALLKHLFLKVGYCVYRQSTCV